MKQIPLTQGKIAFVDDEDFERLNEWKWCVNKYGRNIRIFYAVRTDTKTRKTILMHRQILNLNNSKIKCDHKDRNGLNNVRSNLRIATNSQNSSNKTTHKNTSSIYLGVCWNKRNKKWVSQICNNNNVIYLGLFKTEIEAAIAYNKAAIKFHGEFANLNKIL